MITTTVSTPAEFHALLAQDLSWHTTDAGLLCMLSEHRATTRDVIAVPVQLLDAVHPQLYQALQLLESDFHTRYGDHVSWFPWSRLVAQVNCLTNPRWVQDARTQRTYRVTHVYSLARHAHSSLVALECEVYTLKNTPSAIPGTNTPLHEPPVISEVLEHRVSVTPAWLEEHYPGWDARMITGETLGYQGQELADYVLAEPAPAPTSVALPNLLS